MINSPLRIKSKGFSEIHLFTNAATVNREMCTLRAILNLALVNKWISENPFDLMRKGELITSYKEPPEERFAIEQSWVH